jgi:transcriptional regulator with XRE-family HTH domain
MIAARSTSPLDAPLTYGSPRSAAAKSSEKYRSAGRRMWATHFRSPAWHTADRSPSVVEWRRSDVGGPNGAVVRRLQLGRILRELREQAGLSLEVAAPAFDWSSSKLSRIENGRQGVDVHGVRTMMDVYGVAGSQWEELLDLTRSASEKGWWRAYGLDDKGYVPLEAEATLVREATAAYVPGLLQTEAYARAVFAIGIQRRTDAALDNLTAVRRIRQERLTSEEDPLDLVAVLDEAVLRRRVGGRAVMRAQLAHLVEAAAMDRVTLHVMPLDVGAYPGLSAPFALLTFGGIDFGDTLYVEHPAGAVHISKENEVAVARLKFDRLRSLALDLDESVALIHRVAAEM